MSDTERISLRQVDAITTQKDKVICLSVPSPEDCYSGHLKLDVVDDPYSGEKTFYLKLEGGAVFLLASLKAPPREDKTTLLLEAVPVGYHELHSVDTNNLRTVRYLFVHPLQCFLPTIDGCERALTVQLYAIRSKKNWGIGSYSDLSDLLKNADGLYDYVGVNPLHALAPSKPEAASPYAPDSRMLFNEIYIDVEAAAEKCGGIDIADRIKSVGSSAQVQSLRNEEYVKYREIYAIKMRCLEVLFQSIIRTQRQFHSIATDLHNFVLALDPLVLKAILARARQRNWKSFASSSEQYLFEVFLQWLCADQLSAAQSVGRCGLYTDLAIGSTLGGTDNIITGGLFEEERSLGAPPDAFCAEGQKWNVSPLSLTELKSTGYRYFRTILKQNMMPDGAIRIDHIIGLARRFTMHIKDKAAFGCAEIMPFEEFLAIIAIESHRNHCVVIGEDLGAVPDGLRSLMAERNVLGCFIYLLEKDEKSQEPTRHINGRLSLYSFGTHDCIPMPGYFAGTDLVISRALNRRSSDFEKRELANRFDLYCSMFVEYGLDIGLTSDRIKALEKLSQDFDARIYAYSLDDILGEHEPVNVPGTDQEYPNWCRRYSRSVTPQDFIINYEKIK